MKLSSRAAPAVLLILSSLWMAATVFPLFYSMLFPNADIKHIVRALEGHEILSGDVARLVEQVRGSVGKLRRATQVTAYFGGAAEYKAGESHTTRAVEVSYLAWFEKRSEPTILVIRRTEVDGSSVGFRTYESTVFGALRVYLVPASVMALSVYWFRRIQSFKARGNANLEGPIA